MDRKTYSTRTELTSKQTNFNRNSLESMLKHDILGADSSINSLNAILGRNYCRNNFN